MFYCSLLFRYTNGRSSTIIMTIIQAIILGIVEGITEFLPISSTGHLILTTKLLGMESTPFVKSFEVIIQLGAILAVVVLYARRLMNIELLKRVIVGFIPTAVLGLVAYPYVKELLDNAAVVVWSLLIGGIFLVWFESRHGKKEGITTMISYKHAMFLGLFQAIAFIPGVSRAAATIVGGLILGYDRKNVVEFSFMLAIPTMLAASVLDVYKNYDILQGAAAVQLGVGFTVAFITALIAITWLLKYIKQHTFVGFGYYRIALALLMFAVLQL